MGEEDEMIAVLTGDLVRSTKMSEQEYLDAISGLKQLMLEAKSKHQAAGDIYRGDGFQIQFPEPQFALEYALIIKLALQGASISQKPVMCTLSLAYGRYQTLSEKPNTSMGQVFIDSGRNLEATSRSDITLSIEQNTEYPELDLLTDFLSHLINKLTKSQSELLCQYIQSGYAEHKEIAKMTGTSRQNISNRLSSIGAFLVRDYIELINNKVMTRIGGE